jgi:hypothetical protein
MQVCKADISIASDRNSVVCGKTVTVAEIVLLRHIHGGEDTVSNIIPVKMNKVATKDEIARLKRAYRSKAGLIDELFGKVPRLPATLADIGVDHPEVDAAKVKSGRKAPAKKDDVDAPSLEDMAGPPEV